MSSEWTSCLLENVLEVKYGKDHKKLGQGAIPVYGSGGLMRYADAALYDDESILIPRKGSLNNVLFENKPFWTVDTMFWSKIDKTRAFPKFLYYQLSVIDFMSISIGSAVPSMTVPVLNALEITLPPLHEQKAIADVLSALDDRISLLRETNTTLEAIAQALFKSWFVDFDPVRAKQQGTDPQGMDAATAALFPDSFEESELGEVPKGWRVGSVGDIASVKGGFAYKSTEFRDAGFPVVKIKNIVGDGTVDLLDTQFIGSEIADKTNRFALKDGDVVMAMTGATIGKSGVVVTTGNQVPYLNQRVAKFEPSKQGHDNRWLVFVAFQNSVMSDQVVNAASGSAQPNISTSGIESVRLTIPNRIELLAVFSDYADTIFQSWMVNQKQAQTLAALRDTLLPRLISGQLRLTNLHLEPML